MRGAAALVLVGAVLAAAAEPISWDEAAQHVGEEVAVDGRVLGVHCSPTSCLLAFEPTFNRFTVVVQARSFEKLPPKSLERYTGKRVRVSGRVQKIDGKPEIVVDNPEALVLLDEEKDKKGDETERLARAQTELLERLGDVLARVEEMTERLAATQERVETLLSRLEEREAALVALQPQPLPAPSYGEPQPRPAWESLRTVKRGMTTAQVQRLIGEPEYVENAPGWSTWYYGFGRSISFDARGRATSLVGFPVP